MSDERTDRVVMPVVEIERLVTKVELLREALQAIVATPRGRDGDMRAIAAQALRLAFDDQEGSGG